MAKDEIIQLVDEILGHGGPVHHPKHYGSHPSKVETINVAEWLGFNIGSAFKYVMRRDDKQNAVQDLNKALWYLRYEAEKKRWWRLRFMLCLVPTSVRDQAISIFESEPNTKAMAFYGVVSDMLELPLWATKFELRYHLDEMVYTVEELVESYAQPIPAGAANIS